MKLFLVGLSFFKKEEKKRKKRQKLKKSSNMPRSHVFLPSFILHFTSVKINFNPSPPDVTLAVPVWNCKWSALARAMLMLKQRMITGWIFKTQAKPPFMILFIVCEMFWMCSVARYLAEQWRHAASDSGYQCARRNGCWFQWSTGNHYNFWLNSSTGTQLQKQSINK